MNGSSTNIPVFVNLTRHAAERVCQRGISIDSVSFALAKGRVVHTRGAIIFVVGRREVEAWKTRESGVTRHEGVHVVCSNSGVVITVYRNHDLRGLRPTRPQRGVYRFRRWKSGRNKSSWRQEALLAPAGQNDFHERQQEAAR